MRKFFAVLSGIFSLANVVFVFAALGDLISGDTATKPGITVGLLVFFGGMTALSAWGARRLWRDKVAETAPLAALPTATSTSAEAGGLAIDLALEAAVLKTAKASQGKVTAVDVALATGVGVDAAARALDDLCARGHADLETAPSGAIVYVIHGILTEQEKAQTEEIVG